MKYKAIIKSILTYFHIDVTRNMRYDRLTNLILKSELRPDSNCIDIGSHKGEILNKILSLSPKGKHFAFEPVPEFYANLTDAFKLKAKVFPCALSDFCGESTFKYVKNAPAYSGLKMRRYDISNPIIEDIKVEVNTLDSMIPEDQKIDFVKIDVEGGEFNVLRGGEKLLKKNKPIIIFECGIGGSDYYNTDPLLLFNFVTKTLGLRLYTLHSFLKNEKEMDDMDFVYYYNNNIEYYFVAA